MGENIRRPSGLLSAPGFSCHHITKQRTCSYIPLHYTSLQVFLLMLCVTHFFICVTKQHMPVHSFTCSYIPFHYTSLQIFLLMLCVTHFTPLTILDNGQWVPHLPCLHHYGFRTTKHKARLGWQVESMLDHQLIMLQQICNRYVTGNPDA